MLTNHSSHVFLFENPEAKGRYLCSSNNVTIKEISKLLSDKFPEYSIPTADSLKDVKGHVSAKVTSQKLLNLGFQLKAIVSQIVFIQILLILLLILEYVKQLQAACPRDVDPVIAIDMDPTTPRAFDNVYYQNLIAGKGLFTSDTVLFTDSSSQPTVRDFANSPGDFNAAFATAMRKLGRVGVKTGNQGKIRIDCTSL